jgi:hypothetical protein
MNSGSHLLPDQWQDFDHQQANDDQVEDERAEPKELVTISNSERVLLRVAHPSCVAKV